jgi:hypothetical protein
MVMVPQQRDATDNCGANGDIAATGCLCGRTHKARTDDTSH